jgi:hypothetical protein
VFTAEASQHFGAALPYLSDPGVGTFFNLWAADAGGHHVWQLTHLPIKQRLGDGIPAMDVVHPLFSPDGSKVYWTERYADNGYQDCNDNWGLWRLMVGSWSVNNGVPSLTQQTVAFTPTVGNYVTAMGFVNRHTLLLAGNLSGQHVYGMDQYTYDLQSHQLVDLTNTPDYWDEGSAVYPKTGMVVYMSNRASPDKLDFCNPDWAKQPRERDYWVTDLHGHGTQRLTYLNDATAPEYVGKRVIVAAVAFSPNGASLAATIGIDDGTATTADVKLGLLLIRLHTPAPAGAPS